MEAAQRNRARVRPKSSELTPATAGPRQITRLTKPAATHTAHTEHAAFALELPLQGEAAGGRPDLAFHAGSAPPTRPHAL